MKLTHFLVMLFTLLLLVGYIVLYNYLKTETSVYAVLGVCFAYPSFDKTFLKFFDGVDLNKCESRLFSSVKIPDQKFIANC
jgi:hypothetical protein